MLRRPILLVSLAAITASWTCTLWTAFVAPAGVPERFSTLVLDIAIRKAVIVGAILILLYMSGERLRTLGFWRPQWMTEIGRGILYGLVVFIVLNVGLSSTLATVFPSPEAGVAGSLTRFFTQR